MFGEHFVAEIGVAQIGVTQTGIAQTGIAQIGVAERGIAEHPLGRFTWLRTGRYANPDARAKKRAIPVWSRPFSLVGGPLH